MKNLIIGFSILFGVFITNNSSAQHADDSLIRRLENAEREAVLKGDTVVLWELMSSRIVVQNPENAIIGIRQIMDRVKAGKINYATFERDIENIAFIDNISVVMGTETLIPQGASQNAGKTIKRRFTNVWQKENDVWKLTARQSTVVSVK